MRVAHWSSFLLSCLVLTTACTGASTTNVTGNTSGPAAKLVFAGIPSAAVTAGQAVVAILTVEDANGIKVTNFTGSVTFSSSDPLAEVPQNYAFTAADAGQKSVTFTLSTSGGQTIQATSGALSSPTETVTVVAAAAASLQAEGLATTTSGVPFSITFSVFDSFDNLATGYLGTLTFSSSDPNATLPADFTFTSLDAGTATVSGFALANQGTSSITATDAAAQLSVTVSQISVTSGSATHLHITTSDSTWTAGVASTVTISALDAFGDVATDYTGTVSWTAANANSLPADIVFSSGDAGVKTVTAPTFCAVGAQSVSVEDDGNLTSDPLAVTVQPGALSSVVMSPNSTQAVVTGAPASYLINTADSCGNPVTGNAGTLHFTSSPNSATLPSDQSVSQDGNLVVNATFQDPGTYTFTVTSLQNANFTTSISNIGVHSVSNIVGGGLGASGLNQYQSYACAVIDNANVKCWGEDVPDSGTASGNLGYGDTQARGDSPADIGPNLPYLNLGTGVTATQIYAGFAHTCALLSDQNVKCWGDNSAGQLGTGDFNRRGDSAATGHEMGDLLAPVALPTGRTVSTMALGGYHTCAILDDGEVVCWGYNGSGQLGVGDTTSRGGSPLDLGDNLAAVDLGAGRTATDLTCQAFTTCAVLDTGDVKCWGRNNDGELGLGDTQNRGDGGGDPNVASSGAVDLGTGRTASSLSSGDYHTCVLMDDQNVKCWGYNGKGQLGTDSLTSTGATSGSMGDGLPELALGGSVQSIYSTTRFNCALLTSGDVKCWGQSNAGELGQENVVNYGGDPSNPLGAMPPVNLGTGRTATQLSLGDNHVCAVLDNGQVRCWGFAIDGELGIGVAGTLYIGYEPGQMGDKLAPTNLW